jgi:circadian clock protein KaiB
MVEEYYFCLYVAGEKNPNSIRAISNLRKLLSEQLTQPYRLEIVDVVQNPDRAEASRINATPTLEWRIGEHKGRLIGDFSDRSKVIYLLK